VGLVRVRPRLASPLLTPLLDSSLQEYGTVANLLHLSKWRTVQARRALEVKLSTVGINWDRIGFCCDRKASMQPAATHQPFIEMPNDETRVRRVRWN